MSKLLDRFRYFKQKGDTFADGHGQVMYTNRDWEDSYRQRWQFDKIVRSTHGVNCTGSCSWKIYVKNGLVTWETQQTDYMRSQTVEGVTDTRAIDEVGLSVQQVEEMYRYLAIANYEDRFVIPTSHREMARDAFPERNGCGFTFGDGCHGSDTKFNLFNSSRIDAINITEVRDKAEGE